MSRMQDDSSRLEESNLPRRVVGGGHDCASGSKAIADGMVIECQPLPFKTIIAPYNVALYFNQGSYPTEGKPRFGRYEKEILLLYACLQLQQLGLTCGCAQQGEQEAEYIWRLTMHMKMPNAEGPFANTRLPADQGRGTPNPTLNSLNYSRVYLVLRRRSCNSQERFV